MRLLWQLALTAVAVVGLGLVGWGIVEQRSMYGPTVGFEAISIYMAATFKVALGGAALGFAALMGVVDSLMQTR